MGFFKDGATIFGGCVGIIVLLFIIISVTSFISDYDPSTTINDNMSIELNDVSITVPKTSNYSVNNSTTLDYYSFNTNGDYSLSLEKIDAFNTPNTTHEYQDTTHHVKIMVINKTDLPYIDQYEDGEVVDNIELEGRYFQQKRTINDKVVIVWVNDDDGRSLAQKIVNSAEIV